MAGLTVAVTGTTTFFGEDLLRVLEADDRVERLLALDTKPAFSKGDKTVWHKLDLIHPRAPETLTEILTANAVDVVVHTAILARPIHKGGWAHELEATGTRHLLTAMEAAATRKLVLRSSTICYGALASNPNYLAETAPLQGGPQSAFILDKIEVESQTARFAQKHPATAVTILRFAPLLGPRCDTLATNYLSQRFCPTLLGFDPLVQVLHQTDAIGATVAAVHADVRGAVNVGAPGVVTLSGAIRLAGHRPVPIVRPLMTRTLETLWAARLGEFPPGLLDFLKYVCVADLRRMESALQFKPRLDVAAAIHAFGNIKRAGRLAA